MKKPKLALIDGHSLVYRAFFALPPLRNAKGQPTQAVYGFLGMLLKLLQEEKPDFLGVAFDRHGPVFRNELYEDYKGNRPAMPDDLRPQIPMLQDLLDTLGIARFEREGFEADDVLGTLSLKALDQGAEVLLVTGDRDALQLVRPGLRVMVTRKGISELQDFDVEAVRERYGVEPAQLIDVKGLMGDTSDNIPGVPGVGEKTALKLIREYGGIDQLYARIDEVKGKLGERLREHREQAELSRRLGRIACDVDMELDLEKLRFQPFDREQAAPHLEELGFRSLMDRMPFADGEGRQGQGQPGDGRNDGRRPAQQARIRIITEDWTAGLRRWMEEALARPDVDPSAGFALEAEWHRPGRFGRPLAIALMLEPAQAGAGETGTAPPDGSEAAEAAVFHFGGLLEREDADSVFAAFMEELARYPADAGAVCFDAKPWLHLLRRLEEGGAPASSLSFTVGDDLLIAAYLLDSSRSSYSLEDLAQLLLDLRLPGRDGLLGSGRKARPARDLSEEEWAAYLVERAAALPALRRAVQVELEQRGLARVYRELELPLTPVLVDMERNGIRVDRAVLREIGEELQAGIRQLTKEIHELAGEEFNINSTQQLGQILFERLKLPVVKKTKTGYSTDADVLEQLQQEHPIAAKILLYRQRVKLYGTYVEGLQSEVDEADGRIHTTFHQTVASTGRLSSKDPNLQNIPIREDEGRRLRRAFVAGAEDRVLVAADYSQIELRVLAHFAQDERMLDAFRNGEDIHTATAAEVFGIDPAEVSPSLRSQAKAVNFGIVYGISDFGLANNTGLSRAEAKAFIERYFERYPGVHRYMKETVAKAREDGFVRTLYGRIRPLPELHSRIYARRQFAERTAMNTPIQGTAADIIKQAMVDVAARLRVERLAARLLLQVHDELILEAARKDVDVLADLLRSTMEKAVRLDVPLVVDVKVGSNWYEMEKI